MKLVEKYGPSALITGASSGIGKEFAYRLAEEGFNLVLTARRKDRLEAIASDLKNKYSADVRIAVSDLSKENFIKPIIKAASGMEIGLLINNAGYGLAGSFFSNEQTKEKDMIHVNCLAPTVLAHEFGAPMTERKRGGIIFVSSILGHLATPYMSNYAATKSYNLLIGEALWYELKPSGVDVLVVAPGTTESEFAAAGKMKAVNAMPASGVVSCALKNLGKKPACIPGLKNYMIVILVKLFPRKLRIKILGVSMKLLGRN